MNKNCNNADTFLEHSSYILVVYVYQRDYVTDLMNSSLLTIARVKINPFSKEKVRT